MGPLKEPEDYSDPLISYDVDNVWGVPARRAYS